MPDELPKEIGRGMVQIGPIEIEVIQLDNGQRLITPEGLAAFLQWLSGDNGPLVEALGADAAGGPKGREDAAG
jgi:hypothetical protein